MSKEAESRGYGGRRTGIPVARICGRVPGRDGGHAAFDVSFANGIKIRFGYNVEQIVDCGCPISGPFV